MTIKLELTEVPTKVLLKNQRQNKDIIHSQKASLTIMIPEKELF